MERIGCPSFAFVFIVLLEETIKEVNNTLSTKETS